ncbi:DsbA family protein [Lactobacillus sp. 3B(2020)]|uniref:DsbA family protein n=1 Tax=Lactobacillus sp. 3B(2020) TaxID=2695882 RepID=UPI0015DFA716|nr:DsbA family protein [Lactobacillus sp. 3B(2020)]QLL70364.1 DsbA family protein [Lactobacillus sp. 3B(2020)]
MIEIHLFVNPLGMKCYRCEQDVMRIEHDLEQTKFNYQFIPLINLYTIQDTLHRYGLSANHQQKISELLYQISLDFKAALFQGGKRGRKYLLQLQTELINHQQSYSFELATKIADNVGLDLEMFLTDRKSSLARKAFLADQKMANELKVIRTATAVVFDTNEPEYGVMINDFDYDSLLECMQNGQLQASQDPQVFADKLGKQHHSFRII